VSFSPRASAQANVGRYFRYPDFMELYGDRGFIRGNPALDPEAGLNADAALLYETQNAGALDHARLMTGLFYSRIADLIQFIQNSQATAVAQNFDRVRVIGLEAEATAAALHRVEAGLAYTFQEARDDSDVASWRGKRVPGRPLHELFARAALFATRGKVFYEAQFTEGHFLDRANFLLLPARWLHGAGLTARFLTRWSATFEVKNITNNQAEDYFGFPLPGRSYFGTLTATL
jgi:iron complex outermembrane receptor protein